MTLAEFQRRLDAVIKSSTQIATEAIRSAETATLGKLRSGSPVATGALSHGWTARSHKRGLIYVNTARYAAYQPAYISGWYRSIRRTARAALRKELKDRTVAILSGRR